MLGLDKAVNIPIWENYLCVSVSAFPTKALRDGWLSWGGAEIHKVVSPCFD